MDIAFSPCPNDTFIFNDLVSDKDINAYLYDVETLNRMAFEEKFDLTKLSFYAWLLVKDKYHLLNVGAALGRGCGPLLIVRSEDKSEQIKRVALPGEFTTAHLLYMLCYGNDVEKIFMPFDQIMDSLAAKDVDAGVIIHESRFIFQERGFNCKQDLGIWWEGKTNLPIPLGCIAVRRNLGKEVIDKVEQRVKLSILKGQENPQNTMEYVKSNAQELDFEIINEHIKTYVNNYTRNLGVEGNLAVKKLEDLAISAGIIK